MIPLRNKIAGLILIIGRLFIVYVGYLESIESGLYGIPYSFVRELINTSRLKYRRARFLA